MKRKLTVLTNLMILLIVGVSYAGVTERVSIDSLGAQSNGQSSYVAMSGNGRYVAFVSWANNIVVGDTNGYDDVFVYDVETREVERVSVDSSGNQSNGNAFMTAISWDGRYVAFGSWATNLVSNDRNGHVDIFLHDRQTGETEVVSLNSFDGPANSGSLYPSVSADGRYVAFASLASNLEVGDTNDSYDIFVRDMVEGTTRRISKAMSGLQGNSHSYEPDISDDGRFVVFESRANNLVYGDSNNNYDVFIYDLVTGDLNLASKSSDGMHGNSTSYDPAISSDGRYVAFSSSASNLVTGDTNGTYDVYVHDTHTLSTYRVSVDSDGGEANGWNFYVDISGDGRYVSFTSLSSNLAEKDMNGELDVFVHDTVTGKTKRASVNSEKIEANSWSAWTSISHDGSRVAFISDASNLVGGDTNRDVDTFVHDLGWESTKAVEAIIDIDPNTLKLNLLNYRGPNVITAYIEIDGQDLRNVVLGTVNLNSDLGSVPALASPSTIGDIDNDGVAELMVKFNRQAVIGIIPPGRSVELVIRGEVGGETFEGSDSIRVIR